MDTKGSMQILSDLNQYSLPVEDRITREVDNKAIVPTKNTVFPYWLFDAFAPAPTMYFGADKRPCFQYHVSGQRIDFVENEQAFGQGACPKEVHGQRGYALFDLNRGIITHIERTIPESEARGFATYASIDYVPIERNGKIYGIPSRVLAKHRQSNIDQTFDAHYSSCRFFGVVVKIVPFKEGDIVEDAPLSQPK